MRIIGSENDMLRKSFITLAAAGVLAGCANNGQGPEIGQRTGAGAAIGAVIGGVLGAVIAKDDRAGILIGAGLGGLTGAAIGKQLDQQQKELEKNLQGTGATVVNTGEQLLVNLPSEVTFDFDRADLKPEFVDPLGDVATTLNNYPSFLIDIIGHTDSIGSDAYNQSLSERRAGSVSGFLTGRGVLRDRVVAYGRGETAPVASNDTEAGRAENRRVELIITPITEETS